jgi:hypothetical protein
VRIEALFGFKNKNTETKNASGGRAAAYYDRRGGDFLHFYRCDATILKLFWGIGAVG